MSERIGRAKAIRLKCLDCCANNNAEVRKCPATNCPLWRYRMGREIKENIVVISEDFDNEDFDDELI